MSAYIIFKFQLTLLWEVLPYSLATLLMAIEMHNTIDQLYSNWIPGLDFNRAKS